MKPVPSSIPELLFYSRESKRLCARLTSAIVDVLTENGEHNSATKVYEAVLLLSCTQLGTADAYDNRIYELPTGWANLEQQLIDEANQDYCESAR